MGKSKRILNIWRIAAFKRHAIAHKTTLQMAATYSFDKDCATGRKIVPIQAFLRGSLIAFGFFLILFQSSCLVTSDSYSRLAPGVWRGVLTFDPLKIPVRDKDSVFVMHDQFREGELPFNFEVKYIDSERFYVEIINGEQRIRCDSIQWGRDRTTARDTVNIYFPEYQTYLHADVRGGVMQGEWVVTTKDNYRIPFHAKAGLGHRFTPLREAPKADLSGEWATLFGVDGDAPSKAIGEFRQEGNRLIATFRSETGDYGHLEGTVQGRKFWLSGFDGAHAFLFSGAIGADSLQGEFRSGTHYRTLWAAWRDPDFRLGAADSLARLTDQGRGIRFALNTPEGRELRYPSAEFDGKIKIFTISGTWCHNCRDEQVFLREFMEARPDLARDTRVVVFSFERHKTPEAANVQLLQYKRTLGLPFDVVYAGQANRDEALRLFPSLDRMLAFPTMIVLDRKGVARKVHTGFDGPATSKFADFKKDFTALMEQLNAENAR